MVQMASKKLPREVVQWFRKMGAKGGKKGGSAGGKAAAANMTAKERKARAKHAVAVREAKRRARTKTGD
jgi:transcription initiation factor TFIIIB Brf1 subunit/transcription initiation factor TFIIB